MMHGIEASAFMAGLPPITGARFDNIAAPCGLITTSQTLITTPYLTISFWFRTSNSDMWPTLIGLNDAAVKSAVRLGEGFEGDIGATIHGVGSSSTIEFGTVGITTNGQKHHVFISTDLNHATNAKIKNVYLDGVFQILNNETDGSSGAFNLNWTNAFGLPDFSANLGSTGAIIDYADVWIGLGQYLTDVTLFRNADGSAVDLGADGSTPTGTPPTYFFHGGASTFGTNAGSGPTTSVVGSITDITL